MIYFNTDVGYFTFPESIRTSPIVAIFLITKVINYWLPRIIPVIKLISNTLISIITHTVFLDTFTTVSTFPVSLRTRNMTAVCCFNIISISPVAITNFKTNITFLFLCKIGNLKECFSECCKAVQIKQTNEHCCGRRTAIVSIVTFNQNKSLSASPHSFTHQRILIRSIITLKEPRTWNVYSFVAHILSINTLWLVCTTPLVFVTKTEWNVCSINALSSLICIAQIWNRNSPGFSVTHKITCFCQSKICTHWWMLKKQKTRKIQSLPSGKSKFRIRSLASSFSSEPSLRQSILPS